MPYTYRPIPQPISSADLDAYIALRLLALKTNPEAFGSTYTRELLNTLEIWRERIGNPGRITFIAADSQDAREGEWAGTASIITPELAEADMYYLVGMWVHPDHRRKGVGKTLVQNAIAWVRAQTEGQPDSKRRISLEVHRPNTGAKAMYDGLGFSEGGERCEDPNRIPMVLVAR
ncbi:acyl-CoA N-acyltransferase [Mycena amicta]|nr:acyl-CoA N-acyltransferase [Mycena amicta]